MYVAVVQPLLVKKPRVFVHEISDYDDNVHNGVDVQMVIDALSPLYVVYKRMVSMADYGDCCRRKWLVLVGFLREFAGAHEWELPPAKYSNQAPHCARDIAEPDEAVSEDDKRHQELHVLYPQTVSPPFGKLQRLGRLRPGYDNVGVMGPGSNPYSFLGWDD